MTTPVILMLDVLGIIITAVCVAARIRHRLPVAFGFLLLAVWFGLFATTWWNAIR